MSDWQEVKESVNENPAWNRQGTVQGVYVQKKTNLGPNNSNMYMLKNGEETTGVWGSAVLDARFDQIPLGAEVRITSMGEKTSEKTKRTYQDYKVEFRPVPFQEAGEKPASKPDSDVVIEDLGDEPVNLDEIPF